MAQNEGNKNGLGKIGQQIIENREQSDGGSTQPVANEVADDTATGTADASTTANDTGFNPESVVDATTDAWQHDNNATNATAAATTATPEEVPAWAATNEQGQGRLEQMALQMAGENPTLTPEQKEAEAKERNKKMRWAKLNDAIAAMSNLYFTSKYAPNAFDPNNLATKKLRERYDKIDADRDKDRQAWYNVVMPAIKGDTENQRAYYQLQQQAAEKVKDRQHDLNKLELNQNWQTGEREARQAHQTSERKASEAFTAGQNDLNRKNSRVIASINHSGSGSGSGSGTSEDGQYTALDRNGNEHHFTKSADALDYAKREGTAIYAPKKKRTVDKKGETTSSTYEEGWYPANRLEDLSEEQRAIHRKLIPNLVYGDEEGANVDNSYNL